MPAHGRSDPPLDDGRFAALFEETNDALLAYALRRVVVPEDAADVVAETFLVAWRRIDEVPAGPESRAWLFGVARRVLANHRRGERRRNALADRLRSEIELIVPSLDAGGLSEVERALECLNDDDRELLRLEAWDGLARDEIARALGLTRPAVRVRLHRARKRLREELDRGASPPPQLRPTPEPSRPAHTASKPQLRRPNREVLASKPRIEEA
ncbi:RNA polymerase sigma factor [Isoptericola sp. NPDC056605]|uniref:RNA polymerase sigma factor n=1 Tax=Isoptericola sp. NPDC056605 TaxID=3345876 RepID=UPI003678EE63